MRLHGNNVLWSELISVGGRLLKDERAYKLGHEDDDKILLLLLFPGVEEWVGFFWAIGLSSSS